MQFTSLSKPRTRLADQVYEQIMQAIRSGAIGTEDRIVQEKLAEEFDISRTPVREALFRMEQEGILSIARNGGFRIRQLGEREISELYDARCAIEGHAARLLAQTGTPDTFAALRRSIAQAENIEHRSVEAYFDANRAVHRAIVEAAGNRFLLEFFDNIWNRGSSFTLFASMEIGHMEKSLGDHMALIDAIERGGPAQAEQEALDHIHDGYALQNASRRKNPEGA